METNALWTQPVSKLLFHLALPAIFAQLVTLLYNLVDRIFIGPMSDGMLAMARVGLCAPIVTIITAFTNLFGREGAPLATIVMEEEKYQKAEHYLVTTFISLIGTSCMLTLIVSIFKKEILLVLGASEATLPTRLTIFRSIFWEHFLFSLRWAWTTISQCKDMRRIGKIVETVNLQGEFVYMADSLPEDACAIIVSYSGETPIYKEVIASLKQKKIPILGSANIGDNMVS